jgi:hypothetical protein
MLIKKQAAVPFSEITPKDLYLSRRKFLNERRWLGQRLLRASVCTRAHSCPLSLRPTRWSQAKERRLGEFLKRPTLIFNGYGDQVASLYNGTDLKKYF